MGDVVNYDDPFLVACHRRVLGDLDGKQIKNQMFLASAMKNECNTTRLSNRQLVYMTHEANFCSLWKMQRSVSRREESSHRMFASGHAVDMEDNLSLIHVATNQPLATHEDFLDDTDFGPETEVYCHFASSTGKINLLLAERDGVETPSSFGKVEKSELWWRIQTAKGPSDSQEEPEMGEDSEVNQVVADLAGLVDDVFWERVEGDCTNGFVECEALKWHLFDLIQLHSTLSTRHITNFIDYLSGTSNRNVIAVSEVKALLEG